MGHARAAIPHFSETVPSRSPANEDNENRLTNVTDTVYHLYRSDFIYDGLSRLRKRLDYTWGYPLAPGPGASPMAPARWYVTGTVLYIYDGNRVVQERDGNNVPTVQYTRGLDLSATMEGAGGIGGLLARSHGYSGGTWPTHNFYHADGNGNVTYMVNSSQAMVASYKYDPYGRTISSSGTLADANTYRFSSKEIHVNSGLYYYLYRFYNPTLQRWINRDPLQETYGINPYTFVNNDPIQTIDPWGLTEVGPGIPLLCTPMCPCDVTCTLSGGGRRGAPIHPPRRTYPYFVIIRYTFRCVDCDGNVWEEKKELPKVFLKPGTVIRPPRPYHRIIWKPCTK